MRITWDERKNRINLAKHKFDFTTGAYVFDDPYAITDQDREVDGEPRWQTIGVVNGVHIVLVAHLIYEYEDEETIHIISARKAKPHERKRYARGN